MFDSTIHDSALDDPERERDHLAVNTLRFLAIDAVQQANSGHPGMPMGAASMAWTLWSRHLKHDPQAPRWFDRDRFVLSAGHGSMLLYGLLHVFGYELGLEDLRKFRQWGSLTPGHPESGLTPGVETTTGPLGQGFANGVGFALAERLLAARFNRPGFPVVDHHTYGIVSDGDLMEGISHEAASLAGHLGLGKLIYLYDDNGITIDGPTSLSFSEDVPARFAAYGWHVLRVEDGNDLEALDDALGEARAEHTRPSLIAVRTHIGFGSPNRQDTSGAHGSPLGAEEVAKTRANLGWELEPFDVPLDVYGRAKEATSRGNADRIEWADLMVRYEAEYPELAAEFAQWRSGELPKGWEQALPAFAAGDDMATRQASGKVLAALAPVLGQLVGGSADLTPSNNTLVKGREAHGRETPSGQYFHFGIREHAMAAVCNGMALHGGLRPFCSTFLVFSDYMRPSIRLSALMHQPVVYVFTHDSIGVGEDGPTHQPVEHYAALRAIPHLVFLRPADGAETSASWKVALERCSGPTALALTRQKLPQSAATAERAAQGVPRGAYVVREGGDAPSILLMASGSELAVVMAAADRLERDGIPTRVVSFPSWELFAEQSQAYREEVLPPALTRRVAVEAGISMGWERWVGDRGRIVALDRYGASAPAEVLFEQFGFTAEHVADVARSLG